MSLRSRLLLAVGIIALAALAIADVVTYRALDAFLVQRVDQQLNTASGPIQHSLIEGFTVTCVTPNSAQPPGPAGVPDGDGPPTNAFQSQAYQVRSARGAVVTGTNCPALVDGKAYSPSLGAEHIAGDRDSPSDPEPPEYFETGSTPAGGPQFRVRTSDLPGGNFLVLAQPLSDVESTLHRLLLIELIVSAGAVMAALMGGWWLVRLGLRPLTDIEVAAESIAAGNLTERVPGADESSEVGRLAGTLNTMLDEIETAFAARVASEQRLLASDAQLRRFVADASHELRTPIAAVAAYAELFGRGAADKEADLERVMAGITSETGRMEHLVGDLLLLARLDEGRALQPTSVEVVSLCADAVRTSTAVGPDWPITFQASQPLDIEADPLALRQVVDNLLGNVRSHTPSGTAVRVSVEPDSAPTVAYLSGAEDPGTHDPGTQPGEPGALGAIITVSDNGPGMSPDVANHVFERFYRSDPSRSRLHGGAGLGLSIVQAIVVAHGGTAEVSSTEGAGTTVTIRLPSRPPSAAGAAEVSGATGPS